ncbi:hypothetical protein L6452_09258 [Arctium lappa]|uniref:Uncharacterized protein n=1 Tax=Arctium lappa TaxID=4217 RepID=A0ACB9DKJ3_ARCLA|nr:hypothetical protein L6452_09258 [Arctium lappa]
MVSPSFPVIEVTSFGVKCGTSDFRIRLTYELLGATSAENKIMASGSSDPAKPTGTTEATQSWIDAISDEEEEMEEGGTSEARELHEDDFESDEEPQVEGDEEFEFNSDEERLLDIIDDDNMEG